MSTFLIRCFIIGVSLIASGLIASGAPASGNKKPSSTGGTAINFQRTKTRIDALLTQRLKPESLPENLPNPFQLPESAIPVTKEKDPKPVTETVVQSTDSEMLLYYGAMLKISGTVRINDKTHLVINQMPYKEGDVFTLKTKDATAKLRIVGIAPGELTLGLNDAVQVIKFKK